MLRNVLKAFFVALSIRMHRLKIHALLALLLFLCIICSLLTVLIFVTGIVGAAVAVFPFADHTQ